MLACIRRYVDEGRRPGMMRRCALAELFLLDHENAR
jgi:hypothetical protein